MPATAPTTNKLPITIIGLGSVGSGLARALRSAGFSPLTLLGKGRAGEQRLAKALKVRHLTRLEQLPPEQGFIILALKEAQIPQTVQNLAKLPLPWQKISVLHTSGSLGAEVLEPLGKLGAGIAAWHPYQTFPQKAKGTTLAGITFGIDGNRRGVLAAHKLTRALRGLPLKVSGPDRVLYHLSAVLACGFVAADLQMAVEVLKKIGVPERRALQAVLPIAGETLRQVAALGTKSAMTGPAVRGDMATIRKHLAALRKTDPELVSVYSAMNRHLLRKNGKH